MRLFTALWPDPDVRAAIARWQAAWDWPRQAAPVKPERLHLTLHFLGEVADGRLGPLERALRVPFEPFALDLAHAEVWPNGVALLAPREVPPELARLHAALHEALVREQMPVESRPYKPHVTLARRAHAVTPPRPAPRVRWAVAQGYVLVCSLPGGRGYEILRAYG